MFVVSQNEMKAIEEQAMNQWEMPALLLMESAAHAMVDQMFKLDPQLRERHITVVAGPGNNGGDGLVMARMLYLQGCKVVVFVVADADQGSEEQKLQQRILSHFPLRVFHIEPHTPSKVSQTKVLKANLNHADVVIDALFGLGLSRPLEGIYEEVVDLINHRPLTRYAVDLPSGLSADVGALGGSVVEATYTFALGFYKKVHFLSSAEPFIGQGYLLPAGFHIKMAEAVKPSVHLLDDSVKKSFPARSLEDHKYSAGHLGIMAGAVGMSGAAAMAIRGAQQSGIGVVSALVDKNIYQGLAMLAPEALIRPTYWDEPTLASFFGKSDALLIGPGFGQSEEREKILEAVLATAKPLVIDADALHLLARQDISMLKTRRGGTVLTPHPGEMAVLLGKSSAEVQKNRLDMAKAFSQSCGAVVVLKGHHTIIAAPDGRTAINPVDASILATAGSGDVLAGLLGGLLCKIADPFEAACLAVYLHGKAGQALALKGGAVPLARDIADAIGEQVKPMI